MTKTDENAQAQPVVEKPKTAAQIKAEEKAAKAAQVELDAAEAKAKADAEAEAQAKDEAEKTAALAAQAAIDAEKAKADAAVFDDGVVVADELTPLQLRIKNNGQRAVCHVTRAVIAANDTTVITYKSANAKNLAKGNFAQMNALKGSKRFEVEG